MSYIEESLSSDEKIEAIFKYHWIKWIIPLICTVSVYLTIIGVYLIFSIRTTEQGLTNKRVVFKKGIISRKTEEMKLSSIETIEIKQGVLGRIMGFGDVKITGRGISDVIFRDLKDPLLVKRKIESFSNPIQ